MRVEQLKAFEPGNPFLEDHFHMGTRLGSNLMAMYAQHCDEEQPYLILVNTITGERIKVTFVERSELRIMEPLGAPYKPNELRPSSKHSRAVGCTCKRAPKGWSWAKGKRRHGGSWYLQLKDLSYAGRNEQANKVGESLEVCKVHGRHL